MAPQPALTVVIPTRERCDVLEKSLRTVTSQEYDDLEIIVSDNFSGDATEQVVRHVADPRVRYINTGRRMSMSSNWEFALTQVRGEWVTILGDDDGLLPGALRTVAEIIRTSRARAVRSSVCSYDWPSAAAGRPARLQVPLGSGLEIRDARAWLSKVMRGQAYYTSLPMLYNGGFVSMSVLQEIRSKTGAFYRSCAPDVYSAVAICSVVDSYAYCHEPLAINGASRHSTGTAHFGSKQPGPDSSSPIRRFRSEDNIPFHPDVPLCADGDYPRSIQVAVYESYLQSSMLRGASGGEPHEQQLELILAHAGMHADSLAAWGKLFASKHGLDYERVRHRAERSKSLAKLTSIPGLISGAYNSYRLGSSEAMIDDVAQAAIVAAAVRRSMPGRVTRIHRLVGRAVERLTRREQATVS